MARLNPGGGGKPTKPKRSVGKAISREGKKRPKVNFTKAPPKPKPIPKAGPPLAKTPPGSSTGFGKAPAKPKKNLTKTQKSVVREVYKEQPLDVRKRISKRATGTVKELHDERIRAEKAKRAFRTFSGTSSREQFIRTGRTAEATSDVIKGNRIYQKQAKKQAIKDAARIISSTRPDLTLKKKSTLDKITDPVEAAAKHVAKGVSRTPVGQMAKASTKTSSKTLATAADLADRTKNIRTVKAGTYKDGVKTQQAGGPAGTVGKRWVNAAAVAADDPIGQGKKLAGDTVKSIASIPAFAIRTASDPGGTIKMVKADYKRRYDPKKSSKQQREEMKKEGILPEVADAATFATGTAAATGRILGRTATAGGLGKTAQKVMVQPRPKLRYSGGTGTKTQATSPNLFRATAQKAKDKKRAARQTKEARKTDVDPVVEEAVRKGDITPGKRQRARMQTRQGVAAKKSRTHARMKAESQRAAVEQHKVTRKLSKRQKAALQYTTRYGITTAAQGREVLTKLRDDIKAKRKADPDADKAVREGQRGKIDEVKVLDDLIDNADDIFTPQLRQAADFYRERGMREGLGDPSITNETVAANTIKAQGEALGVTRKVDDTGKPEPFPAFAQRVAEARGDLAPGGYVPDTKYPAKGLFAAHAPGGSKAVRSAQVNTGSLRAFGRSSRAVEDLDLALQQNRKRKYNWNLVADEIDGNRLDFIDAMPKGVKKTAQNILNHAREKGLDTDEFVLIDTRKIAAARKRTDEADPLSDIDLGSADIHAALGDAVVDPADRATVAALRTTPDEFTSSGWQAVPRAVYDEIMADTKPSGKAGRSWEIAKGKASRILLANPAWLGFQMASNALLTGLAGTGPVSIAKAQRWWRTLTPEEQEAIGPYIGVHRWYDEQVRMGAASDARLVNAYRGLKQTNFWRQGKKLNPLDAIFRADNAQNAFFRKAVFYNQAKREAYRRMNESAGRALTMQESLEKMLRSDPGGRVTDYIKNIENVETHARHVNDFLGDYLTYTAKERRIIGRAVMFYGFLRFSLRFTFYTMPMHHPVMASIATRLGQIEKDELSRIFGTDVPPWEVGNYYSKDGGVRIQATRMNPYFNALPYNANAVRQLVSFLPPFVAMGLSQASEETFFTDKPWTVDGSAKWRGMGSDDVGFKNEMQILLKDFLSLFPAYRSLEKTGTVFGIPTPIKPIEGRQTSDSSLLFPSTTKSKTDTAKKKDKAALETDREQRARRAIESLVPFLGSSGKDEIRKAREYEKDQQKKAQAGKGRKKKPTGITFGSGSSGMKLGG